VVPDHGIVSQDRVRALQQVVRCRHQQQDPEHGEDEDHD